MFNYLDFNLTHYLDALRDDYLERGYDVSFLPFTYSTDFLPLAANATQRQTVTMDHDSDFVLGQQTHTVFDSDGDGVEFPNYTARIIAESSQRQLQNRQTHAINIFGSAQRPFVLYKPLVLAAKTTLAVEAVNLTAGALTVRQAFNGCKVILRRAG